MKVWKQIKLGDAATFHNGYAFKPSDWSTSGKEIIRIQNLTKGSSQTNYFKGELPNKYRVSNGDILISWSGSLGVYEWQNGDAWLNQHLFKVVFDKEEIDKSFFKHLMNISIEKLETQVHGATMKHITKKNFDDFIIPLPPLDQQKKIANILDAADAYRQKTKALLGKYDELTQSLFLDMFGDTWQNPKKWKEYLVEELASKEKHSIKAGPFGSSLKKEFYVKEGYKIYGQEQVIKDDMSFGDYYIDNKKYKELESCKVKEGDVLISLVGTYGKISVIPSVFEEGIINPRLMKISPDFKKVRPDFLKILLQGTASTIQMKNQSRGGTMDIVNVGIMRKIKLPVPPLNLQNQFAERVQAIEQPKAKVQGSLEKAEALFQSLLQRAFKGELN